MHHVLPHRIGGGDEEIAPNRRIDPFIHGGFETNAHGTHGDGQHHADHQHPDRQTGPGFGARQVPAAHGPHGSVDETDNAAPAALEQEDYVGHQQDGAEKGKDKKLRTLAQADGPRTIQRGEDHQCQPNLPAVPH
jgi:hypothetical protein